MYKARFKVHYDSVSVEELNWSAESQVLIPAEHLWCDFKFRPWAKNESLNTNDLYIHYMDKSTVTPPSLEEKKALPNCGNKYGNIINVLKLYFHLCCNSFEVYEMTVPICISHWCFETWFLVQCLHLKSHRGVQLELGLGFLQTSQVLPHWLNYHFSLNLASYTEALSC